MKTIAERIKALISCPKTPFSDADEKALSAMEEPRIKALEDFFGGLPAKEEKPKEAAPAVPAAVPAATTVAALAAAAAAPAETKVLSEDDYLKAAPKSIQDIVAGHKAAQAARKVELVTRLKGCSAAYTEDELNAMDVHALEKLVTLADALTKSTDFSARGVPRAASDDSQRIDPPPSLGDRLRAATAKK